MPYRIFLSLNKHTAIKSINDQILAGIRQGNTSFDVTIKQTATYSNICAPVAGVLDYYKQKGYSFNFFYEDSPYIYASHTQIDSPKIVEKFIDTVELNYRRNQCFS